jgi:hypothetical protein
MSDATKLDLNDDILWMRRSATVIKLQAENARLREAAQRVLTCADTDECGHEWWTGECLLLLRHELSRP